MKLFAVAVLAGAAYGATYEAHKKRHTAETRFMNYVAKFAKNIRDSDEYGERLMNFKRNDAFIAIFNATEQHYQVGYSAMTDMDDDDFENVLGALDTLPDAKHLTTALADIKSDLWKSVSVDWRNHRVLPEVHDQGQSCASGWAFAASDAAAASYAQEHGELLDFSAQELIDCTMNLKVKNLGCKSGSVVNVLEQWYMKRHYMTLARDYDYTGEKGKCQYDAMKTTGVYVDNYVHLAPDNKYQMKNWLSTQPLIVSFNAKHLGFKNYQDGIFFPKEGECDTTANHFGLLVGYGTREWDGQEYWILKNSWGTGWGEKGYAKIASIEGEGVCGIQKQVLALSTKCENENFCGDLTSIII